MAKEIDGVKIKKLGWVPDERGRLMEIMRCDDDIFGEFGQVYLTTAYPGAVKAWHAHALQDDNLCVLRGMAKIVLCDLREGSPTYKVVNEFFAGEYKPVVIHIPKLVYHGFKGMGECEALILNVPTKPYNPNEPDEIRLPYDTEQIDYNWERRNF